MEKENEKKNETNIERKGTIEIIQEMEEEVDRETMKREGKRTTNKREEAAGNK